jgi:hypothetical protein
LGDLCNTFDIVLLMLTILFFILFILKNYRFVKKKSPRRSRPVHDARDKRHGIPSRISVADADPILISAVTSLVDDLRTGTIDEPLFREQLSLLMRSPLLSEIKKSA